MARATAEQLARLQAQPSRIRNLCVLAHVDHGKTTLSDSLVSSNGLISTKSVGKVRYMDYLPEEQERGITMKSSSISLYYKHGADAVPYLINLIDSPGHVDFSFEVSTAVRLTDGALVVVDVVEGVCIQTETVLRQAYADRVRPVLVLNKIDRLFNERHLSAEEAYYHLRHVLEQVNGVAGELFKESQLRATLRRDDEPTPQAAAAEEKAAGGEVELEAGEEGNGDDDEIYFSPTAGNVVFASAYDCWGFRTTHFADAYAKKLNIRKELLLKTLWGEFYFSPKAKRIYTKAQGEMAPMFVQFCLKNIWDVYQATMVDKDAARVERIAKVLNVKLPARDLAAALRDPKAVLSALMGQWLPLADAVLAAAVEHLPSPVQAAPYRLPVISRPLPPSPSPELVAAHRPLLASLTACNPAGPVVVFVSKVFAVPRDQIVVPRRQFVARPRPAAPTAAPTAAPGTEGPVVVSAPAPAGAEAAGGEREREAFREAREAQAAAERERASEEVFVGLARVFSGTLRRGQRVQVLGPRYSPARPDEYRAEMDATDLYLLMGRALEPIEEVPAGNVFGLGGPGVESLILKTATLSESPFCTTFAVLRMSAAPIVRVAVEPRNPLERPKLAEGLRRLEHSDPLCTVAVLESGEHVVAAAGELHLERCLKDLRERFARIELVVSPPLFSFRETIVPDPRRNPPGAPTAVQAYTANRLVSITVRAAPLGPELTRFLDDNADLLRRVLADDAAAPADDALPPAALDAFRAKLAALMRDAALWPHAASLWALGPRRCGANLLFCSAPALAHLPLLSGAAAKLQLVAEGAAAPRPASPAPTTAPAAADGSGAAAAAVSAPPADFDAHEAALRELASSVAAGFQVAAAAGPLCEEPMSGVAFFVEALEWHAEAEGEAAAGHGQGLTGQVISAAKDACRAAFLKHSPRLVEPFFLCDIQVHADSLGKLYSVLGRRRAKVFREEPREGTHVFTVQAHLPVAESIGFSDELLKKTSGSAYPQLVFSHWDVLEQDPYWMPTAEELEQHGDNASAVGLNVARRLMDDVRRRKGLFVEAKIVEHADKQRTLKKNK